MSGFSGILRRAFGPAPSAFLVAVLSLVAGFLLPTAAFAVGEEGGAEEKPRLAFVIGNSEYGSINKLRNPVNDGKLIAGTLKKLHFEVIEGYDLTLADMFALFNDHKADIDNAEAVVVYYAGHGFQMGNKNYLVPVDAAFEDVSKIGEETVGLDSLIQLLESPDRPLLMFLDACRNNPLKIDNGADGLAQVTTGTNTFVAFATSPGSATKDGSGTNSPYARALAKNLEVPGLSIMNLDIDVRNDTQAMTLDTQKPWAQQSLLTDFFFSERQTLNPNAVLFAANTIMTNGDDKMRLAFQTDMEELGLQGAVMRAQQREVVLQGLDLYSAPKMLAAAAAPTGEPATLELASGSTPTTAVPMDGATVAAPLATLFLSPRVEGAADPAALARDEATVRRQLQTELRRLGCYNMAIDGDWGNGSKAALRKYLEAKRLPATALDATPQMLNQALLEPGRVCRAPVAVRPATKKDTPSAATGKRDAVAARTEGGGKKATKPVKQMKTVQSFRRPVERGDSAPARQAQKERRNEVRRQMGAGFGVGGF